MADALANARLLVTGGAGFIGSNFARLALARWPSARVHVLDALTYAGNQRNLEDVVDPSRLSFQHGDIRDPKAVAQAMEGVTHVVNFAAESMVDRSIDDPGSFVLTDTYGAFCLLEAARHRGIMRFVQISTDEVYGEIMGAPATEESPLVPRNPYAASKAGGDRLAYAYHATYGLPVVITRCSNNYGPYQYPEKLIPLFVTNALEDEPLPVYGSGKNLRDWIHVDDHCTAIATLLEAEGVEGETFNIGAGNELDVLTITSAILERTGKPASLIKHVEDRPGHDRRYALDSSKLTLRTGWKPARAFGEGIAQTIDWYAARRDWWEPIKAGEFRAYYEKNYGRRKVLTAHGESLP
jgi:dTDP-glucose 4,6-dehydratase